ncbi:MAG TPA: tetratricopeptide repeat protein [Candidatus Sulfotelmatobacter sp.]|nr:tetratricopeptide repeat protein [Candidatus Sulfotelmatobacter sp.]
MSLEPATLPAGIPNCIRFGEDFELDPGAYKLRRSGRVLKLERIPMEILLLLVERQGEIVTREEIVARIWGKDVYLDTDNSINGAIRKIRQALRDDPEQPRFIQTITGTGYRFIAPVVAMPTGQFAEKAEALPQAAESGNPIHRKWTAYGAMALVLALGVSYFAWMRWRDRPSLSAKRQILAVLPFENLTGDAGQEYFSDGITEEMITALGGLDPQHLGVIGRTSVMLYKHNPKALDQVGRELGAQYVLEGSVQRDAGHLRVTAQLIQVKDQTHLWARTYDREVSDVLALQQEVTQEIADEIELVLGAPRSTTGRSRQAAASTRSSEAYDLYLRGRYFWNKRSGEGFQRAAEYFQQAIDRDPNYARAYAGLADTFGLMSTWHIAPQNEFMRKARTAALNALKIDGTLAEAHASLALIAENYDYDWRTAEKEFQRAIQLDPEYPTAHQWYAECLGWQGRFDEAFAESERARQLDPMSLIIASDYVSLLYLSRDYDRAILHDRALLDMDPSSNHARSFLIYSYLQLGKFSQAQDEIEGGYGSSDPLWVWVARAQLYGRWGRTAEAEKAVAQVESYASQSRADLPEALFRAYAATGRKDQALAVLEKAYSEHSNMLASLKVDPMFDPLRGDPRFQDLLRRVGLSQ